MIKLIDKQKIIISYYREGKPQRQIAREVGINRKTIRRYIREYEKKKNILTKFHQGTGSTSKLSKSNSLKPSSLY